MTQIPFAPILLTILQRLLEDWIRMIIELLNLIIMCGLMLLFLILQIQPRLIRYIKQYMLMTVLKTRYFRWGHRLWEMRWREIICLIITITFNGSLILVSRNFSLKENSMLDVDQLVLKLYSRILNLRVVMNFGHLPAQSTTFHQM